MNVKELIHALLALPVDWQSLPVYVENGMDPSDPEEAKFVVFEKGGRLGSPDHIEIR